jgi:hypothetical protein
MLVLLNPSLTTDAQCGTQASSCKSCHEVQGELPVNTDGTGWHESHAFGDFCYICHAGNQQVTDKDEAHIGMVAPLSDTKASCQMCHAADLDERAQVYATTLNIDLSGGAGSANSAVPTAASAAEDFWGSEPAAAATTPPVQAIVPVAPVLDEVALDCPTTGGEMVIDDASFVDYVQRYDEIVLGKSPVNWGNIALGAMIGLVAFGGSTFVVWNEIRRVANTNEMRKVEGEYPADVVEMLPALTALNAKPRQTLKKILSSPQKTDKVLGLIDTVIADDEHEDEGK